jgi:hypothetical protein
VVLHEDPCIPTFEGSLGRISNTAPISSDAIPMGSKRFALQGIEYAFLRLVRISTLEVSERPSPRPQKNYI